MYVCSKQCSVLFSARELEYEHVVSVSYERWCRFQTNPFAFALFCSLEQVLHVVLSKRRHTRNTFPASVRKSIFDTAMAESYMTIAIVSSVKQERAL
jgi:hypothetical protein